MHSLFSKPFSPAVKATLSALLIMTLSGCSMLNKQPSASPGPSSPVSPSVSPSAEASASPSPSDVLETPQVPVNEYYKTDTIKAADGTVLVEYEAAVPLISGGSADAITSVNEYYKQEIEDFLFNATTELKDVAERNLENSRENDSSFIPCYASENYTIQFSDKDILSVSRDINFYFGSVNVDANVKADTFDLKTGCRIILDNVFSVGEDAYLGRLSQAVTAQIEKKGGIDAGYYADYAKLAKEYLLKENFYLTDAGVVIFYPSITIAPQMLGICRFEIPYADLKDILSEQFRQ